MDEWSQPGGRPDEHIRVSNDERAKVAAALSEAAGRGLLTLDEADERMATAYAAKTRGELAVLTADLPPDPTPQPTAVAPVTAAPRHVPWLPIAAFLAVLAVTMVVAVTHHSFWFPWPIFVLWFVFARRQVHGRGHRHHQHVHHHHRRDGDNPWSPPRV